jgi:hypothetical protein
MADDLNLMNKRIELQCPICGVTYPYNLANLMGFSLEGASPTRVLGLLSSRVREGETVGVAEYTRYPGIRIDLTDAQTPADHAYDKKTQEKRAQIEEKMEKELEQPHTYIFTCPKDQKQMQVSLYRDKGEIKRVSDPEAVTPGNAALYEAGKQIQTNSLSVASSFCSTMVTVSTGAVQYGSNKKNPRCRVIRRSQ